jgi:hypothetical protein
MTYEDGEGKRGHPILFLSRGKKKKMIFCKNSKLENRPDSENTLAFEPHLRFAI